MWTERGNGLKRGQGKQINYNVTVKLEQKQVEAEPTASPVNLSEVGILLPLIGPYPDKGYPVTANSNRFSPDNCIRIVCQEWALVRVCRQNLHQSDHTRAFEPAAPRQVSRHHGRTIFRSLLSEWGGGVQRRLVKGEIRRF